MRKPLPYLFVVLATLTLAPLALADDPYPQKPGKWQLKMEMEIPGMPMKMPPVTFETCITEEDVKDAKKALPNDPKSGCTVGDYKIDGKKVTWTVDCPKQQTKGTGEITFSDESFTGSMRMTVGEQEMKTKYSGKWLGAACEKK